MINCSRIILLCSLFINCFVFSQNEFSEKQYYELYDSYNLNQNLDINNGFEYIDIYKSLKRDNHKFYHSPYVLKGSVIYRGQPYYGVNIKYELLSDLLLLETTNQEVNYLALNSEFVSEFIIDGDKFVRLPNNQVLAYFYQNGFFKEVFNGSKYSLFVKYIKQKNDKIKANNILYEFSDKNVFVLFNKNNFYVINKIKDIVNILPINKKQLQLFYSQNKKLYKEDKEQFLERLFKSIDFNNF